MATKIRKINDKKRFSYLLNNNLVLNHIPADPKGFGPKQDMWNLYDVATKKVIGPMHKSPEKAIDFTMRTRKGNQVIGWK